MGAALSAETVRIAVYHGPFSHKYPAGLLKELTEDARRLHPFLEVITEARPDVLVLTRFDWDADHLALAAMQDALAARGMDLPHRLAEQPNTGQPSGTDLDGDGRYGEPEDAQGYGWFSGQGGVAVLSRRPVGLVQNHSSGLWREAPGSLMTAEDPGWQVQRLSTSGHWVVDLDGLHLGVFRATTPVFDGPEDRNGRRNADEVLFWVHHLKTRDTAVPFVLAGHANLDPVRGEGRKDAIAQLLALPQLQALAPQGAKGDATAFWPDLGPMRLSYVLPGQGVGVLRSGIVWPKDAEARHALVWADVRLKSK